MSGFLTDFANNQILDAFFGSVASQPPGILYFGLSQIAANKPGSVVEPNGGNYSRVAVANDLTHFPAAHAGSKTNATSVLFPNPTQDWGSIQSIFICDNMSNGHVLAMADLPQAKPVSANTGAPSIAIGALYISHT